MEVTFTPSVVLAYSARRRSGSSFPDLIITKLPIDCYLSSDYISQLQERSGIMVNHRDEAKRVAEIAENAGIAGAMHPMAEIGQSLAETAETPCKNFARETVRILLSLFRGALHSSGSLKTTGGNAGNAQISRQASAGSDSDHEAAIARI
jgi:hypothetical protein